MQRAARMLGATAVIAAATACGTTQASAPPTTSAATTPAPPPVTVTTTAAAPTTATATATATATTAPTIGRCTTRDLAAKLGGGDAGLDNLGRDIVLTDTSTTPCTVTGYPGIGLADSTGHLIAIDVGRSGTYFAQNPPLTTITLTPRGSAVAALGWNDAGGPACTGVVSLQVIPPDQTTHLTVAFGTGGKAVGVCDPHVTRLAAGTKLTQ
jgi:hypothetical protein